MKKPGQPPQVMGSKNDRNHLRRETEALFVLSIAEINSGFTTKDSKSKVKIVGRYLPIFNEALISWPMCLGRHTRKVYFISLS